MVISFKTRNGFLDRNERRPLLFEKEISYHFYGAMLQARLARKENMAIPPEVDVH